MRESPFRLLAVDLALWGGFESALRARLDELGLREPDTLMLERLTKADLDMVSGRIEHTHPDALFSGGTTQTLKLLGITRLPIVAWGQAMKLATGAHNLCGYGPRDDMQHTVVALLKRCLPDLHRLGVLYDDRYVPGTLALAAVRDAASTLGIEVVVHTAKTTADLDLAFSLMRDSVDAVRVVNSPFLGMAENGVVERALAARLPLASYEWATREGGFLSYMPDFARIAPLFADLLAAIAGGASPEAFGVRPSPMALAINRTTAHALGIEVPPDVLEGARIYE